MLTKETFYKIRGGVDVPHLKNTADSESVKMTAPSVIILLMRQHIGVPCLPTVKIGDKVSVGQVVGNTDNFVSAPIHSTVSGTVEDVKTDAIYIESDGRNILYSEIKSPDIKNRESFLQAVRQSGIVGMGGAGFPAHVKLTLKQGVKVDTLIINGAECEPYITADYREIMENYAGILSGIEWVMEYIGIDNCIIGIEGNKPKAITLLTDEIIGRSMQHRVNVVELPAHYPYGAEKMLIRAVTGRIVPLGNLPCDVGIIVLNISTISALNDYFDTGIPLVQKRITVAGGAIAKPQNVFVPIGTPIQDVVDFCGGYIEEPLKVIKGGPMMGVAQQDCSMPITKQDNAILCMTAKETYLPETEPCIRCGRCVQVCPMNLMPTLIERYANRNNAGTLGKLNVLSCMECGCCAYVCPARRPLVEYMRQGKQVAKRAL